MTAITQFFYTNCLQLPPFLPKKPTEKTGVCWLCGGEITEHAWTLKEAFSDTFTDFASAKRPDSDIACYQCVALSKSEAYSLMADKYGKPRYFPEKEGKVPRLLNWVYTSHVFNPHGYYEQPDRKQWREILLNPPEPPFGMIMAVNGKKHVIFRGEISHSRETFTVQADEQRIIVNRTEFAELLALVEEGYNTGFSKDSMLTGDYNHAAILKCGLSVWQSFEERLKKWRFRDRHLLFLATYCCIKHEQT